MTSPLSTCPTCGAPHAWTWEEAFNKFGFGDGDGLVLTDIVADALREGGYRVELHPWGMHNVVITSILRAGTSLIPETAKVGYDDPRSYLPSEIVDLLDHAFPHEGGQP